MPVYTEDGYALTRTIEALALQRDDMHRAFRNLGHREVPAGVREPEIHVIAIFDGYDVVQVRQRAALGVPACPLLRPHVCLLLPAFRVFVHARASLASPLHPPVRSAKRWRQGLLPAAPPRRPMASASPS